MKPPHPNASHTPTRLAWASAATHLLPLAILVTYLPAAVHAQPAAANSVQAPAQKRQAVALLLAHIENGQAQPGHYLASEKLNGVRALWDGRVLRSRQGHVIPAPAWFTQRFPARALDGELWIGRKQFDRLSAAVHRVQPDDAEWRHIRYMVFELPDLPGTPAAPSTFRQRNAALGTLVAQARVPWLQHVQQSSFASRTALERQLQTVVQAGGEGLMLHRADAPYTTGRSDVLLKMKPWHDAEATVIAHLPGKGKYSGMLEPVQGLFRGCVGFKKPSGKAQTAVRLMPAEDLQRGMAAF